VNLFYAVEVAAAHDVVRGRRHIIKAEKLLAFELIHRKRAREHPRARVRDAHRFEHALDAAVFAVGAVEGDDRNIDGRLPEHPVDVSIHEHFVHTVASSLQRLEHGFPGLQGDFALRAHAPEQYADVFILHSNLLKRYLCEERAKPASPQTRRAVPELVSRVPQPRRLSDTKHPCPCLFGCNSGDRPEPITRRSGVWTWAQAKSNPQGLRRVEGRPRQALGSK
jgi:hypothetical protein